MKLIDEFMDARQAAEQLGLGRDEVYRLVRLKRLRCYRFGANGGLCRFRKSDLQDYIQSCVMEPTKSPKVAAKAMDVKLKHLKG